MKRRLRDVAKVAESLGFALIGLSGGSHLKLRHAGGQVYFAALTPSCHRGERIRLAALRRIPKRERAA